MMGRNIILWTSACPLGQEYLADISRDFQTVLIAFIFKAKTRKDTDNYLYDFLFAALIKALCDGQMEIFMDIRKSVNCLLSTEKTCWGTQVIVFSRILINTINQTVSIPLEKHDKAVVWIRYILSRRKTLVLKLQQLTRLLDFICKAMVPTCAFTRRLYSKFSNPKLKKNHHIKVDDEIRADCGVWLNFLSSEESLCGPFMDFSKTLVVTNINFYTDVSGSAQLGFDCVYKLQWMQESRGIDFINHCKPSIEFLELFALVAGVCKWAENLMYYIT